VQGHTVLAGDQVLNVPGVCSIKVQLFAKAAMVPQVSADVVLYKITGAKCGQATLCEKYASTRRLQRPLVACSGAVAPRRATPRQPDRRR
jgi:hypothetical protein